MNATNNNTNVDQRIADAVTNMTDQAPTGYDGNRILSMRAERLSQSTPSKPPVRWRLLAGAFALAALAGGAWLISDRTSTGQDIEQTPAATDPAPLESSVTTAPPVDENAAPDTAPDPGNSPSSLPTTEPNGTTTSVELTPTTVLDDTQTTTDPTPPTTTVNASGLPESAPADFWAVNAMGALLRIDARTGAVLASIAPATQSLPGADGDFSTIDVSSDGSVYVGLDCCDFGDGTIARVDTAGEVTAWSTGIRAVASPNGTSIAVQRTDGGIDVRDTSGALLSTVNQVLPSAQLHSWMDDRRILVSVRSGDRTQVAVVAIDGSAPVVTSSFIIDDGRFVLDAATRKDGMVLLLVRTSDATAPLGWLATVEARNPEDGELLGEVDVDDATFSVDYDRSGTFLITTTDDMVVWLGGGQLGSLTTTEVVRSGSWH